MSGRYVLRAIEQGALRAALMGSVRSLVVRGRLGKAARRQKQQSVDDALRSSKSRRIEAQLRAVFADWRERAARKISEAYAEARKAVGQEALDRILASLDADQFSVEILEVLTPGMQQAFARAGIAALLEAGFKTSDAPVLGGITDHMDEAALSFAQSNAADLVTDITTTTRNDLRELVSSAIEDGASPQSLSSSIEDLFSFSPQRSDMIARTELAFAHVQGNLAGYRESGLVEGKRWLTAQDNVCPRCEALDGQEVELDETFQDEEGGEDVQGPPLHPNCRCDVVPVLADKGVSS